MSESGFDVRAIKVAFGERSDIYVTAVESQAEFRSARKGLRICTKRLR